MGALYTILIVDDNKNNLFSLRSLIEEYIDAKVIEADCGEKALKELMKNSIDLIILDVQMEGMDGFELAQIIKQRKKTEHIPIVFLTASYIGEEYKNKGFKLGAVDYLTKPIDDFLFVNRINVYLRLIEKERTMNLLLEEKVKEQTKELREAKEAAENANEAKSIFLANISHELRTPLNILLGSSQIINYHLKNDIVLDRDKLQNKLNTQIQNCYRLIRLVNNLIDITKLDSGNFMLSWSSCNIVEVVEAISQSVVDYASNKGITLIFDTDSEEEFVLCDLDSIERIVLNLLSNAIKFTPEGGDIFVNIKTLPSSIQIIVKDNGIGIPQDKLDMIFERFKQVDNLFTRKNEGSGIGLSLVKMLVQMHNGTIEVRSDEKSGSEFVVELPRFQPDAMVEEKDMRSRNAGNSVIEKINIEFSDIYF